MKKTFEQGMEEAERLVKSLEEGNMSLEDSFQACEKAKKLLDELNAMLDQGAQRVLALTPAGDTEAL